ncbi:SDR family oxidoreductase [Paenibacillus sp. TH7-28]
MTIPRVGTKYRTIFEVTEERVHAFSALSGDVNPLHISLREARQYGFDKPVAHGAILLSEISRIIGTELPGEGALWSDVSLTFLGPVFWGDILDIEVEVLRCSAVTQMAKLSFLVKTKETGREILTGTCLVMVLKKFNGRLTMPQKSERIVLVTGGSRGAGLACVTEFLKEGYTTLSLSRRNSEGLELLQQQYEGQLHVLCADVSDKSAVSLALKQARDVCGPVNMIVHGASPVPVKASLQEDTYEAVQKFMDVYVGGLTAILNECLPSMTRNRFGRIVTLGTSYILGPPPRSMYPYVIAKEALWGMTKSLAADYGGFGITCNMVSPSMMLTDLTAGISNPFKMAEAEKNPMKRLAEPEEVAKTVMFLCEEGASFINGTNTPITGGGIG